MWLAGFKKTASLYIATNHVVLQLPGQQMRQAWAGLPWQEGLVLAAEAMKAARQKHVAVWLSGALARPFLIPLVQGLKRWKDVEQLAQATAPAATQLEAPMEVWIGRWSGQAPALAVATPRALHDALDQMKSSHGLHVALLRPAWHWALTSMPDHDAHLGLLLESDACTSLKSRQGQVQWVATATPAPLPAGMSSQAARTAFAQEVVAEQTKWGLVALAVDQGEGASSPPDQNAPPLAVEWH